jgi:hypothetical protein
MPLSKSPNPRLKDLRNSLRPFLPGKPWKLPNSSALIQPNRRPRVFQAGIFNKVAISREPYLPPCTYGDPILSDSGSVSTALTVVCLARNLMSRDAQKGRSH